MIKPIISLKNILKQLDDKGLTIVELMIVSLIMVGMLVGIWGVMINSLNYIGLAREESVATDDLKDVMEKMKCVIFSDLFDVFPDNQSVDPDLIGGFLLNDENIVVTYPQGTNADPLEIEVEVTWTRKTGGTRSLSMQTIRSRYIL
ncbi:MAG: hypothetical protein PVH45_03775 [Candidatus Omnitrophota bacterium]|jgi:hypothetical protein